MDNKMIFELAMEARYFELGWNIDSEETSINSDKLTLKDLRKILELYEDNDNNSVTKEEIEKFLQRLEKTTVQELKKLLSNNLLIQITFYETIKKKEFDNKYFEKNCDINNLQEDLDILKLFLRKKYQNILDDYESDKLSEKDLEKLKAKYLKYKNHSFKDIYYSHQKHNVPNLTYYYYDILKKYNFDAIETLYLFLNFDYLIDKYGYLVESTKFISPYLMYGCGSVGEITGDVNIDGKIYDYAITEEGVNFIKNTCNIIKNVCNNNENLIGRYNYFCLKNVMINVNTDELMKKYNNISLEEIIKLNILCHNNKTFFEKYLEILNSCNLEQRNYIFNFIEPFSFMYTKKTDNSPYVNNPYLICFSRYYIEYILYILDYIFDYKKENDLNFHFNFALWTKNYLLELKYRGLDNQKPLNTFFMKEFEFYFLELYPIIQQIINLENWEEIFKILLKLKNDLLINHMPKATGKIYVKEYQEPHVSYVEPIYHEEGDFIAEEYNEHIGEVCGVEYVDVYKLVSDLDLHVSDILNIKNALNYFFTQLSKNVNDYNYFDEQKAQEIISLINDLVLHNNQKIEINKEPQLVKKI